MTPGEIGTEAGRIFTYNLPPNWLFRSQEDQNDHGIDAEIEVTDQKGVARGSEFVFKVQIKGETHCTFLKNKEVVSFNLSTSKLRYYLSFNIPVILVVVEVSSETIYWLSITDNEELISKAKDIDASSIQIHIPTQNIIKKRDEILAQNILSAVIASWDYLALKGVRGSIQRFSDLDPQRLESRIEEMGNALYKAHHQHLQNLLGKQDFTKIYKVSTDLIMSAIVPAADRFVAGLYYRIALRAAPLHKTMADQANDIARISMIMIALAREERSATLRHFAFGLARTAKLKYEIDSLMANHNAAKALSNTGEGYIFRIELQKQYSSVCISIKKLIDLLSLTAKNGQYQILYETYLECVTSLILFSIIQKERGSEESIDFFQNWMVAIFQFCLTYSFLSNDLDRAGKLYSLALHSNLFSDAEIQSLKVTLGSLTSQALQLITTVEKNHQPKVEIDFLKISTEEQKAYFRNTARNMGMDPEDPENVMGQIVARALINFDPTEIVKNCEHLFVHYRPGGIVAQTLQMHSAGGMHIIVCLKHKYAHGTGNLLHLLYNPKVDIPEHGFKKTHCDKCSDCVPRSSSWQWSLAWHEAEKAKHVEILKLFKGW
ncbi:DUF4365 domain-containing protein [Pseudomonas glycinae]|uniref:DUF4365 domain-containing protein n=1 Tax=Candidatus Pseudomonas auctus TaxID=3461260 RepID=UPI003B8F5D8C